MMPQHVGYERGVCILQLMVNILQIFNTFIVAYFTYRHKAKIGHNIYVGKTDWQSEVGVASPYSWLHLVKGSFLFFIWLYNWIQLWKHGFKFLSTINFTKGSLRASLQKSLQKSHHQSLCITKSIYEHAALIEFHCKHLGQKQWGFVCNSLKQLSTTSLPTDVAVAPKRIPEVSNHFR